MHTNTIKYYLSKKFKKKKEFSYNSSNNSKFLTVNEIKKLVKE